MAIPIFRKLTSSIANDVREELNPLVEQAEAAASAAQAGVDRYFATISEGISGSNIGQFFASSETGSTRVYLRTGISPFYVDQGDSAAPVSQAQLSYSSFIEVLPPPNGEDDTSALLLALSRSKSVQLRSSTMEYKFSPITIPEGTIICGNEAWPPTVIFIGNGTGFTAGGDRCGLKNVILNGSRGTRSGRGVYCTFNNFELTNVKVINFSQEGIYLLSCTNPTISKCSIINNGSSGIVLDNVDGWEISGSYFSQNTNFGCFAWKATRNGKFESNRGLSNGLELYGQQFDCHSNSISLNRSVLSGDNGLSINGYFNRVIGNFCDGANYHGIGVYGSGNIIEANICCNNGRSNDGGSYGGITVIPDWGGIGRDNTIGINFCFDNKSTPTQVWGLQLLGNQYIPWTSGISVNSNTRRINGYNLYRARNSGTTVTGSEPTHTSGEVTGADGITWVYCASLQRGLYDRQKEYSTSTLVEVNDLLFSGRNVYIVTTSGTTGETAPTSTSSGSITNGTATLVFVRRLPTDFASTGNIVEGVICWGNINEGVRDIGTGNVINTRDQLSIRIPGTELTTGIFALNTDPTSNRTGRPGSISVRTSGDIRSKAIYIKNSGTGTSGWLPLAIRDSGTSAQRPTSEMISGSEGYMYYDTTINKPIWWNGTGWRDSDGSSV